MKSWTAFVILLALWAVCHPLWAADESPGYARCQGVARLLHWPQMPVRVCFAPSPLNTPERRRRVQAGFDEWVQATGGAACYRLVDSEADADITVSIAGQVAQPKNTRTLGQTVLTYTGTILTKVVIQLVYLEDNPAQCQEICAHEFGHALGIDGHSDDPGDMMFPVLSHSLFQVGNPELDWLCRPGRVTPRDAATLAAAYPAGVFLAKKR